MWFFVNQGDVINQEQLGIGLLMDWASPSPARFGPGLGLLFYYSGRA